MSCCKRWELQVRQPDSIHLPPGFSLASSCSLACSTSLEKRAVSYMARGVWTKWVFAFFRASYLYPSLLLTTGKAILSNGSHDVTRRFYLEVDLHIYNGNYWGH